MQTQYSELTDSQWQFIEKELNQYQQMRKRKYSMRVVMNAILWLTRTGCQWRNLDMRFPYWQLVYYYFNKWTKAGLLAKVLSCLVSEERKRLGRAEQPSRAAIDSQSVKKGSFITLESGIDGGKQVNGRKRHLAVDGLGLPLAIAVTAAHVHDSEGGYELLWQIKEASPDKLKMLCADKAYRGSFKDTVEQVYHWQMDISQKPQSAQGFVPQKGRWQVERSFGWLNFYRRLSKDYEKTAAAAVSFIQLAFINIIIARLC